MTTRDDLKAFLVADIPSRVVAFPVTAYAGQRVRSLPDDGEVRVRYRGRAPIRRDTGQERHDVDLIIRRQGMDSTPEDGLAELMAEAADELIAAYDGRWDVFQAGMSDVNVEKVRCYRSGDVEIDERFKRTLIVKIELDEMRE